jgi:uncharacterized protein (TIGR02001 family)
LILKPYWAWHATCSKALDLANQKGGTHMNSKVLGSLIAAVSALALPSVRAAEEAKSPHTLTGNIGVVSDYRFRGVSQTQKKPALQGGVDYAHTSGFYLGAWASNISDDLYVDGDIEVDLYGGYTGSLGGDLGYNVGGIYYVYPGSDGDPKYDTFEIYGGLTYKWLNGKLSYSLTDFFGIDDGNGSYYLEGNANYPLMDKVTLTGHLGWQKIDDVQGDDTIADWSFGATYDLNGFLLGLTYVDTDEKLRDLDNKNISKSTVVLSVKKNF